MTSPMPLTIPATLLSDSDPEAVVAHTAFASAEKVVSSGEARECRVRATLVICFAGNTGPLAAMAVVLNLVLWS